jgi:DNA-binding GntR family transcriptional regulator
MSRPVAMTKAEDAFSRLRDAIEQGELLPGQRIKTSQLTEEFAMSPAPIREALRLLQAQGLVEHRPHRGVVVSSFSVEKAAQIYALRLELEPLATRWATARASEADLLEIRARNEALRKAIRARGPRARQELPELNAEWHRRIYAASGSAQLEDFIERLWRGIPYQAIWLSQRAEESIVEHDAIVDAIGDRDAERAAGLMRTHIERGAEGTLAHLRTLASAQ